MLYFWHHNHILGGTMKDYTKEKKDSYGKYVKKDMTADEYWDQEEKDLNDSYKESVRQREERSKRASINKAPKVF